MTGFAKRHVTKLSINFKEMLPHDCENSEEQNKVLEPSINYY